MSTIYTAELARCAWSCLHLFNLSRSWRGAPFHVFHVFRQCGRRGAPVHVSFVKFHHTLGICSYLCSMKLLVAAVAVVLCVHMQPYPWRLPMIPLPLKPPTLPIIPPAVPIPRKHAPSAASSIAGLNQPPPAQFGPSMETDNGWRKRVGHELMESIKSHQEGLANMLDTLMQAVEVAEEPARKRARVSQRDDDDDDDDKPAQPVGGGEVLRAEECELECSAFEHARDQWSSSGWQKTDGKQAWGSWGWTWDFEFETWRWATSDDNFSSSHGE